MKRPHESVLERRTEILRAAERHGASNVRLFGSVARAESDEGSDVDILVEMESGRSLLDLIALEQELEQILGVDVDVLTTASLSPYMRAEVEREARAL
jgi:predicted nucleotidyltransferase